MQDLNISILQNGFAKNHKNRVIRLETAVQLLQHDNITLYDTKSVAELGEVAEKVLRDRTDILVISGGDGTLHLTITELIRKIGEFGHYPMLLILRGGTMNMAASNLGTRRTPLSDLKALGIALKLKREKNLDLSITRVRPLRVDYGENTGLYGFVFAAGVPVRVLNEYYKGEPSPVRAANITLSVIKDAFLGKDDNYFFQPIRSKVLMDGKEYPDPFFKIAVVSAVPKLLLWFSLFDERAWDGKKGFFGLINSMETTQIGRNIWSLSTGRYKGRGQVNDKFNKIWFEHMDTFTIDGELYGNKDNFHPVTITSGPMLRFIDLSGIKLFSMFPSTWYYDCVG